MRSVGTRLSLVLVILILITTVALSVINYVGIRDAILSEVHLQLKLQNESMREILVADIDLMIARVDAISNRAAINDGVNGFLNRRLAANVLQDRLLDTLRNIRRTNPAIEGISIASLEGTLIASTNLALIGNPIDSTLLEKGQFANHISLLQDVEDPQSVVAAGPIADNQDETIAVVVIDLRAPFLARLSQLIKTEHESSRVRLGRLATTGEFEYLFTSNSEDVSLMSNGEDVPMALAIEGRSGYIDSILDHRDVEVVTAYDPLLIQNSEWGLVSQVDVPEIYQPLRQALWVVLITAISCSLLAVLLAIYVVKSTLNPIYRLVEATGRLKQDDEQLDVEARSADEIGVLGRAFNAILKERSGYTRTLRKEVTERTEALEKSNVGLQNILQRVESQNDLMEQDLRRAEVFQKSLLPKVLPKMEGYAVGAMYVPGTAVGGDLYDVIQVNDEEVAILVADSAGHGAGAAMLSVLFKLRLETTPSIDFGSPAKVFESINDDLAADFEAPGIFVTALLLVLNKRTRSIKLVSAGHPPLLLVRGTTESIRLERTGPALGLSKHAKFTEWHLPLLEGDKLLMYTDGLFDVGDNEPPNIQSISKILQNESKPSLVLDSIFSLGSGSVELPDRDDVTLCLLTVSEEPNWVRIGSRRGISADVNWNLDQAEAKPVIEFAQTETTTYFYFHGRVTWLYSESFYDSATTVVQEHRPIVIEFENCEYMDSAMLGTLHEIVTEAARINVDVRLQHVSDEVRHMFVELGLGDVLDHIVSEAEDTPSEHLALSNSILVGNTRLIRAHDSLSQLNLSNRENFGEVVRTLREEYHDSANQ